MQERKRRLLDALEGVPGWLGAEEAWTLFESVRRHPSEGRPVDVVEIGSWQGRSTIVLARAVRERPEGGVVNAIDPHSGTDLHGATQVEDTFEAFRANVAGAGVSDLVTPIRLASSAARPQFAERSVDALFVDGAHGYQDVVRDIDDWTPALRDAATVAFHDAMAMETVRRAIRDRVLRFRSPFFNPRAVENTLFLDFRRGALRTGIRHGFRTSRFRRSFPADPARAPG